MIHIRITRFLKRKSAIISSQISDSPDEHFAKWRMDVEEECSIDVPAAHFAEMGLIPTHPGRLGDVVKSGGQGQGH